MKKLFAIAFTCVYLLLTVGVTKTTRYCTGRINASTLAFELKDTNNDKQNLKREVAATDFFARPVNRHVLSTDKTRNTAEFFILSDLYSEAFVVLIA